MTKIVFSSSHLIVKEVLKLRLLVQMDVFEKLAATVGAPLYH